MLKCLAFILMLVSSFAYGNEKLCVIHSSDAGADDFVTSFVLAKERNVDLKAIVITNADCIPEYALSAYGKFMDFVGKEIRYGLSESRTWNQFPWHWRADTIRMDEISSFKSFKGCPSLCFDGDRLLYEALKNNEDVVVVATGPLTTLADVLKKDPALQDKIRALYWMGGAIDVPGNLADARVHEKAINDKAEWNVFADAFAADWIFKSTNFDIFLIPLDLTNYARITPEFLFALSQQHSKYAKFILNAYQAVCDLELYYMWDVVTAVAAIHPEFFEEPILTKLAVETSWQDHGAIVRSESGRDVNVLFRFKDDKIEPFHQYILNLTNKK